MTTVTPGVWTPVENTGVSVRYDGTESKEVALDEHGAVILPPYSADDEVLLLWSVIPGDAPVFRIDQMPDTSDPAQWPAGFILSGDVWMKTGT